MYFLVTLAGEMKCTSRSHFRSSRIFLNHAINTSIHPKSPETPVQYTWGKQDGRSQGTPVRGDPATGAAAGRSSDMGGLEDRPPWQVPRLIRRGRTVSRGWLCRDMARVFARGYACVCGRSCGFAKECVAECWRSHRGKRFSLNTRGREVAKAPGMGQACLSLQLSARDSRKKPGGFTDARSKDLCRLGWQGWTNASC